MTKIDFRALANHSVRTLTPYQPGMPVEIFAYEQNPSSLIKLANNENPMGASPLVMLAAQKALQNAHFYPDGECHEIRQALSNFLSVQPEQITLGNGSENILELIIKTYLDQDATAIISQYAFLTIPLLIKSYGIAIKTIPAREWEHDITGMIDAVDEKTRVLFLVNPNNPTGTFTNKTEFLRLMQSIPSHVLIVVDEAYFEYIDHPDYPDALHYLSKFPNLVITRTFSKAYGLAALRLGYAISSADIADMLNRSRLPFNVNSVAAIAACAALSDQKHVKTSVSLNRQGMLQLEKGLQQLKLAYISSIANFITVEVQDAMLIYQKLLQEGVIIRPLTAYGMKKHIRVSIGTPKQNAHFLIALERVIDKLP